MANQSNPKRDRNNNDSLGMGPGVRPFIPRKTLKIILFSLVLFLIGIAWLISAMHPLPPHTITMATGPEGSTYAYWGKRYKILLAKEGIDLILKPTAGGVENLNLLRDPKSGVQLGFVEGGVASDTDSPALVSLGTLGYEPVWFFSRKVATDRILFALQGKRVSVGPEGSDTRSLVEELLKRSSLKMENFQAMGLEPEEATAELLEGKIDAAILMTSWSSPVIRKLMDAPGINLANFSRADAYVALFPSLYKRVLPAGVADLKNNRPPRDTTLLATKTSLIVRADLHPALQYLLLETASEIHSHAGIFQKAGEFPAPEALEIELGSDARHYYKSGRPFLQRYMPFWLAALVEQAAVLVIPLLGLLYPLVKGLASLYGWGMQRKIFLIYGELHWLEVEINKLGTRPPTEEILTRLKHLEERTNRVKVSSNYIPMLYSLKENIAYVRARLIKQGG
jgi:TRAP-type uncharacterized transport system substrate-binding protein